MVTKTRTKDYASLIIDDGRQFKVNGRVYLDPRIYEDEMKTIFGKCWVYVGHLSEVPTTGDRKLSWIGETAVTLVRRGEEDSVLLIGHLAPPDSLDNAPTVNHGMYRGFVWGCLGNDGIAFEDYIDQHVRDQIDLFCNLSPKGDILLHAGEQRSVFNANWKFQAENVVDGYHGNFTHQSYYEAVKVTTGVKPGAFSTDDSPSLTWDLGHGHSMIDTRPYAQTRKAFGTGVTRRSVLDFDAPWAKTYVRDMARAYGRKQAEELLVINGTHIFVFPNLAVLGSQVRVIRPLGVGRTEVTIYPVLFAGAPLEFNKWRLAVHEAFYGPAGGGQPDDIEMFERNQMGLHSQVNPWLVLNRGLHRERHNSDGTIVSRITDEVTQRAIWRAWKSAIAVEKV